MSTALYMLLYSNDTEQFNYAERGPNAFVPGYGSHDATAHINNASYIDHLTISPNLFVVHGKNGNGLAGLTFLSPYNEALEEVLHNTVGVTRNLYSTYYDDTYKGIDFC